MGNPLHYIIRAIAYVCARKEKGIVLTEMKGFSGTYSAFKKNASAFDLTEHGIRQTEHDSYTDKEELFTFPLRKTYGSATQNVRFARRKHTFRRRET